MRAATMANRTRANSLTSAGGRIAHRLARRAGFELVRRGPYDLVRKDYYSPVPDISSLPDGIWTRRSSLRGLDLREEQAIEFVERDLAPFIAELDLPWEDQGVPGEFFLRNATFEAVDAELLYAMVRAMRPSRVVELGSGYSTLLIHMACRQNARDGLGTSHDVFDPYPREQIFGAGFEEPTRLRMTPATEVPLDEFKRLQAGDVLFVDTTHTVKLGSDVNFIVLDVLPVLRPGVVVHFHDIFVPWEYPRIWFEEMQYYWAEQYLLQAFLAFNSEFEVLVPAQALSRTYPDRLRHVIPSFTEGCSPASMWLRRRSSEASVPGGH